jgi:hypothetical protein
MDMNNSDIIHDMVVFNKEEQIINNDIIIKKEEIIINNDIIYNSESEEEFINIQPIESKIYKPFNINNDFKDFNNIILNKKENNIIINCINDIKYDNPELINNMSQLSKLITECNLSMNNYIDALSSYKISKIQEIKKKYKII